MNADQMVKHAEFYLALEAAFGDNEGWEIHSTGRTNERGTEVNSSITIRIFYRVTVREVIIRARTGLPDLTYASHRSRGDFRVTPADDLTMVFLSDLQHRKTTVLDEHMTVEDAILDIVQHLNGD